MTGEELRDRRMATGTTQEALAEHLGVTQQTLARWETDRSPLPDGIANRVKILLPKPR